MAGWQCKLVVAAGVALAGLGTAHAAGPDYTLSQAELDLDCKKLTGRMQLRILQIRDFHTREGTTLLSQGLQSATTSIFGGDVGGGNPAARNRADRAMLEAYNRRLAELKCRTFDLESELTAKPVTETPTPVTKPRAP